MNVSFWVEASHCPVTCSEMDAQIVEKELENDSGRWPFPSFQHWPESPFLPHSFLLYIRLLSNEHQRTSGGASVYVSAIEERTLPSSSPVLSVIVESCVGWNRRVRLPEYTRMPLPLLCDYSVMSLSSAIYDTSILLILKLRSGSDGWRNNSLFGWGSLRHERHTSVAISV